MAEPPPPTLAAPPARPRVDDDGALSVAALADRLAQIAPKEGGALTALIAGEESGRAAGLALALGRRLAKRGRAALIDLGDLPQSDEAGFDVEDEDGAIGLAELLDGRASFAEALHRDRLSDLDLIPAGVGAVSVETLGEALAALAASYDFLVMHAYDWRSPAARAARDGVAVLAIVAPPARLAGGARRGARGGGAGRDRRRRLEERRSGGGGTRRLSVQSPERPRRRRSRACRAFRRGERLTERLARRAARKAQAASRPFNVTAKAESNSGSTISHASSL